MPKKPRGTTLFDTQRGKKSERLLKSARQFFFSDFFATLKEIQLQNVCFSSIWDPETIC